LRHTPPIRITERAPAIGVHAGTGRTLRGGGATAVPPVQTIKEEVLVVGKAMQDLLLGMREAMTIWLALVAVAVTAFVLLSALARQGRPRQPRRAARKRATRHDGAPRRGRAQLRCNRLAAQAVEQRRYADEVAVVAGRAAVTAERRHAEWVAAQRGQEAAWRAFDAADRAARRLAAAAAYPLPESPQTPAEYASRERYLHRAGTAAYRRGELSLAQLVDVLSHRNGWDPRLHPFEQEATIRRIGRQRLLEAYRTASAIEQEAWQAADVAAAAKRSLDQEASGAAVRASHAHNRLAKESPQRRVRAGITRWPSLATR
jgi:hypothetical protein